MIINDGFRSRKSLVRTGMCQHLQSNLQAPVGRVTCKYRDFGGNWKIQYEEKSNLIVFNARTALAHLIATASSSYKISYFKVGTRGVAVGTDEPPIEPIISQTALLSEGLSAPDFTYQKTINLDPLINGTYYEYDGNGNTETAVRFVLPLNADEANNRDNLSSVKFSEIGLYTSNNLLFARHTFATMMKMPGRDLIWEWIILF